MMKKSHILVLFMAVLMLSACGSDPLPVTKGRPAYTPETTVKAERVTLPRLHEAVGTVKALTDTSVEAQVTGRVAKVFVSPGDSIKAGDTLIILDSRASQARLERSRQAANNTRSLTAQAKDFLSAAQADFDKSKSTYRRMKTLNEQQVVTAEEVEKAESAYLQAKARLGQAEEGVAAAKSRQGEAAKVVQEAEISLGYTTITAHDSGEVAQRMVEPGDLAFPGKKLLTLQTGGSLRLEAMVRESLISHIHIGEKLQVTISALAGDEPLSTTVDEIEPLADPVTRSFLVKVKLPVIPGLYPGMFGRLRIPQGTRDTVLIPAKAVSHVGQLETVMVNTGDHWESVFIRTGKIHDDKVEVLSGLSGGETIGIGVKAEAQ